MSNLKLSIYFSCIFDTFIAFPGTVISQHSSFALHSPFTNDGLRFHVTQLGDHVYCMFKSTVLQLSHYSCIILTVHSFMNLVTI